MLTSLYPLIYKISHITIHPHLISPSGLRGWETCWQQLRHDHRELPWGWMLETRRRINVRLRVQMLSSMRKMWGAYFEILLALCLGIDTLIDSRCVGWSTLLRFSLGLWWWWLASLRHFDGFLIRWLSGLTLELCWHGSWVDNMMEEGLWRGVMLRLGDKSSIAYFEDIIDFNDIGWFEWMKEKVERASDLMFWYSCFQRPIRHITFWRPHHDEVNEAINEADGKLFCQPIT